ncbi:hypothetical protein DFH09DRAFT_1095395 [Mycena vulgaris]|nr:hypothetical protein DFH09DRAFT_1095395 [Mycena vulgaris]
MPFRYIHRALPKDVHLARLQMQADARAEKTRGKLELARLKMDQEHEYRMAQVRATAGPSQSHADPCSQATSMFGSSSSHASGSHSRFYDDIPILHTPSSDSSTSGVDMYGFPPGDFDLGNPSSNY